MITLDLRSDEAKLFDRKGKFVKNNGETVFEVKGNDEFYRAHNQEILLVLDIEKEDNENYKITAVSQTCQTIYRTIEVCDWRWFPIIDYDNS